MAAEKIRFLPEERRAVLILALLFLIRMLGLFAVLPLLSPYAASMKGHTPLLIGLAVGGFPLSQTLFQIPFGWLSDRWGRKQVIVLGLLLFSVGGGWAALADSIWTLIAATFLQGSGAVTAVILALTADVTRDEVRSRAMAMLGAGVGLALCGGFVIGPLFSSLWGTPAVFWMLAVLGIAAIPVTLMIPLPAAPHGPRPTAGKLADLLREPDLWRISLGHVLGNGSFRAFFVLLPFLFLKHVHADRTWVIYLPILIVSGVLMFALIFHGERRGRMKDVRTAAIAVSALGLGIYGLAPDSFPAAIVALTLFFVGFSLLEAILPAAVTQRFDADNRGSAVGVFNVCQYIGMFLGSILGGIFLVRNPAWLFGGLVGLWLAWAWWIRSLPAASRRR